MVEERRVAYDVSDAIESLRASKLYAQSEVWSNVMINQLQTGADHISMFLDHVENLADELGYAERPVSNAVWRQAAGSFDIRHCMEMPETEERIR